MEDRFFCAVKRRKVEDVDCAGIICQADASCIAVCRTCERGKALASTAKRQVEHAAQANAYESSSTTPALSVWEKIQRATGCASYGQLAKMTGYADTVLRLQIARLQEGKLPRRDNGAVPSILRAGKLTLQDLIPGVPEIDFKLTTHASSSSSSSPQPSGPVPSAGPEGTSEGEAASESFLDAYDAAGVAMGLEVPAFEKGRFAACADLPDDFRPYTGQRPLLHGKPALHIKSSGDIELSCDAVALGGLEHVRHVRPFWSDRRKQIGLAPVDDTGPGVLKLQSTACKRRRISASGFINGFGIRPEPGTYPMELHSSGLIVATITQQPAQPGGEA